MTDVKWPEWQPIETAPKDGRAIVARNKRFHVRAVWWFRPSSRMKCWRTWENDATFYPTHWLCELPDDRGQIEERSDEVAAGKENSQPDTQEAIARTRP